MTVIVSACLLGENCKYSGGNNYYEELVLLLKDHKVIPVCPEVMGGLPVPRLPAEILGGAVYCSDGTCVDAEYRRGALIALEMALKENADCAVLQPRSPSCGVGIIYDGTFSGRKIPGSGVFARLLEERGIPAYEASDFVEKFREKP